MNQIVNLDEWTYEKVQSWIINQISEVSNIDSEDIDILKNFSRFNIDSSDIIGISGNIEETFKIKTDPTLLYEYVNIESLSKYIFNEISTYN